MILDGIVQPLELAHLPYKKHEYEYYVGRGGLKRDGKHKWRRRVADVVARLIAALQPDDVVLGGGNVKYLAELPPGCRKGENANAFVGGFRLWNDADRVQSSIAMQRDYIMQVRRKNMETTFEPVNAHPLTGHPAWKKLEVHSRKARKQHLRELFAADPERGQRMTAEGAGIYLDYSKNRVTDRTLGLLLHLADVIGTSGADRCHVPGREDQYHGKPRCAACGAAGAEGRIHRC